MGIQSGPIALQVEGGCSLVQRLLPDCAGLAFDVRMKLDRISMTLGNARRFCPADTFERQT